MSQEWYYTTKGQKHGPVASGKLKELATSGQLQRTDPIWRDGMEKPVKAGAVKGIFSLPPPVPVMTSPAPTASNKQPVTANVARPAAAVAPETRIQAPASSVTLSRLILPLCWIGVIVFAISAVWYVYHSEQTQKITGAIERGGAFWDKGEKDKAVEEYKAVLDNLSPGADASVAYQRVIDYDLEINDSASAEHLLVVALDRHISITFTTETGRTLLAKVEKGRRPQENTKRIAAAERTAPGSEQAVHGNIGDAAKRELPEGVLSEEYYPLLGGQEHRYLVTSPVPGDMKHQILRREEYSPTGEITITCIKDVMVAPDGTLHDPGPLASGSSSHTVRRRVTGEYIEVEESPDQWEPIIKIGAKPGDTWEWKQFGRQFKQFKYLGSELYDGEKAAVVEATSSESFKEMRYYRKGVGLACEIIIMLGKTNSTRVLTSDPNCLAGPLEKSEPDGPMKLEIPGARELAVNVKTSVSTPPYVGRYNSSLRVRAYAMTDRIIVTCNVNSEAWNELRHACLYQLLIRLFDKNGQYLTHFLTKEGYTAYVPEFQHASDEWRQLGRFNAPHVFEPVLLKAKGNRLEYIVNTRDMQSVEAIEIGFFDEQWTP